MTKGIKEIDRSNVGRGHQAAQQSNKSDRSGRGQGEGGGGPKEIPQKGEEMWTAVGAASSRRRVGSARQVGRSGGIIGE